MSVALVFAGQGAQSARIRRARARHASAARVAFLVGDARPPSSPGYDGPSAEPTPNASTQPAHLALGVVGLRALSEGRVTEASDV